MSPFEKSREKPRHHRREKERGAQGGTEIERKSLIGAGSNVLKRKTLSVLEARCPRLPKGTENAELKKNQVFPIGVSMRARRKDRQLLRKGTRCLEKKKEECSRRDFVKNKDFRHFV